MKVTPAGQVIIPPDIQSKSGIRPGSEVDVSYENGAVMVRRTEPSERVRAFRERLEAAREIVKAGRRKNVGSMQEVEGLSRGEQFVRLLAGAGTVRMTTEEIMELTRGPYDDLDHR